MKNCTCGAEAIIEHEGSDYFACCVECTYHILNQVMLKLLGTMAKLKNSTNGENHENQ
ncbi:MULTISPECIES: hypothetical protein [Vibrio]|uniref:hypothetical protein n=1 Tax=Vibrio TaxID=662 RepID=UPI00030C1B2D|nr:MULTISPECIES: hypothetical protein [Vibrio]EHY9845649.1 hypothetical protein [Vibrio cholerae]MCS0096527.1 hypothetical protein [Vibrio cholerae]